MLLLLVGVALSLGLSYYFALSGNPIAGWREERAVRSFYEGRYHMSFDVLKSNYDYKRGEFSFDLTPEKNPEHHFTTTLYETNHRDVYGETRATAYLRRQIADTLTMDDSVEAFRFHVSENYDSPAPMETDLMKRLGQNQYTISFSFDVAHLGSSALETLFDDVRGHVESAMDVPVGGLTLRLSAYDGTDYAHEEMTLMLGSD